MTTLKHQERFKTLKGVFDEFTNRNLFELQSRKAFDELVSPWEVGKESNVFLANKGNKKVIVKIYRIQNCDFRRMFNYLRVDPRYQFLQRKRRQIVLAWAQREYKNLRLAQEAGAQAPRPLAFFNNVLVEEMIGKEKPAPALKDAPPEDTEQFFQEVIGEIKKIYRQGLIHGDLSAFNILNFQEHPYFIDFSQAAPTAAPNAAELLERDVKNVVQFFAKRGVKADREKTLEWIKS